MKYKRQNKIIKIVKSMPVHTHDELIEILKDEGFKVTQATVSRDIKELGLIKVPMNDGSSVYSVPETTGEVKATRIDMISESVKNISAACHTVVINTYPGMASAVAAAIDNAMHKDMLGSIAGDDTVLLIAESEEKAEELERKIRMIFKSE